MDTGQSDPDLPGFAVPRGRRQETAATPRLGEVLRQLGQGDTDPGWGLGAAWRGFLGDSLAEICLMGGHHTVGCWEGSKQDQQALKWESPRYI